MNLFFLGTAAAEGYPGLFCDCENCREARELGGRSLRYRSALLVNDDLLLDFGPDLLASSQRFHRSLARITTTLVTHAHEDHFSPYNFAMRKADFTAKQEIPTMQLYGPKEVTDVLRRLAPDPTIMRMEPHTVHAGDRWEANGYTFEAYKATHAEGRLEALFYSVEDEKHAVLYATDTGPFADETWKALAGKSFDVIIMEETMGKGMYNQHLGFYTFLEQVRRMRVQNMLRPGGRLFAHHMSHSGNPTHEKVEAVLCPHGVEVAYDGLEVVLGD